MLQNLLLEKMLKQYDFLTSDLKYKKAVISEYLPTFIKEKSQTIETSNEDEELERSVKRIPSDIEKQIYRQISKITHPDKNENDSQFKEAVDAYSSGNFLQLIKIAQNLQIQFQMDAETIKKIEAEIKELQQQNSILEQHLVWRWYLTEDLLEKEELAEKLKRVNILSEF